MLLYPIGSKVTAAYEMGGSGYPPVLQGYEGVIVRYHSIPHGYPGYERPYLFPKEKYGEYVNVQEDDTTDPEPWVYGVTWDRLEGGYNGWVLSHRDFIFVRILTIEELLTHHLPDVRRVGQEAMLTN